MKSFQDWLDCQLYSSHLKNLTKIREETLTLKASNTNRKFLKTACHFKNISRIESIEHRHQLKTRLNCSKSEIKQNQIHQENINLANRLLNVSSVISKDKQIQSYRKYQSLFKKHPTNKRFDTLKAKKLQSFLKVSEQKYLRGVHKAILKIKVSSLPRVPQNQTTTIWIQVYSGAEKASSSHYSIQKIFQEEISIPLRRKVDRHLILLVHCSKGLEYLNLGEYCIQSPLQEKRNYEDIPSNDDPRKHITISVQIQQLKKQHKFQSFYSQMR